MSSRSKFVQINRSLIVLDPGTMPVNLAQTVREDAPEQSFPALAYDGKDVLPTALGYTSYFGEHTRLNIGDSLKGLKVQHVLQYQSVNMRTLSIALCETGIYIAGSTDGSGSFNWQRVVDFSASFKEGVRRLWTFCVISNRMYMYQQGQDAFYGLVNPAEYMETTVPSAIKDASITQVWYHEASQAGILKYNPNFINMEGQLGIFKAGNRLGFWDSDGAVAWSSATQVYDFVPSTTTFAGITKFSDVVGRITVIHQHGTGFIIYATRSVVVVSALSGSPEKWAGRAIFSDVGVVFDSQVAMAQPDSIHYAITSAGLCRISNGSPEIIETEVMDYVRHNNDIYAVSFVDSRYLFIHVTNTFESALPEIDAEKLTDSYGNQFYFPRPEIVPVENFIDYFSGVISSKNPQYQGDFEEVQEPVEPLVPPSNGEALLPCWTGGNFKSSWSEVQLKTETILYWLNSKIFYGVQFPVRLRRVVIDNLFPTFDDPDFANRFYDKAGEEFTTLIQSGLDDIQEVLDGHIANLGTTNAGMQTRAIMLNSEGGSEFGLVYGVGSGSLRPEAKVLNAGGIEAVDWGLADDGSNELSTITVEKILDGGEIEFLLNECGLSCTVLNFRRLKFTYKFSGIERVNTSWRVYAGVHNFSCGGTNHSPAGWLITNTDVNRPTHPNHSEYLSWREGKPAGTLSGVENFIADTHLEWVYGIGTMTNSDARGLLSELRNRKRAVGPDFVWMDDPMDLSASIHDRTIMGLTYMWSRRGTHGLEYRTKIGASGAIQITHPDKVAAAESMTSPFWILDTYTSSRGIEVGRIPDEGAVYLGVGVLTDELVENDLGYTFYRRFTQTAIGVEYGNSTLEHVESALRSLQFSGRALEVRNKPTALSSNWSAIVEVEELPLDETRTDLIKAEVSGFGYYPQGGFSFRKTHSRSIFKPCDFNKPSNIWDFEDVKEGIGGIIIDKTIPGAGGDTGPTPPYSWDYPETIPLPPNYALFQEGTFAPYYPTYEEAVVLDTQLMKWGRYNNQHKYVYNLFPLNRTDQTIMPTEAGTMRAGALSTDGGCTIFTKENPASTITYGKIGDYRLGWTKATKAVAQFGYASDCYMIVETSINGDTLDVAQSHAIEVVQSRRAEMPFTLAGKWFNIRFQGTFNLVGLSLESEAKSRR